MPKDAGSRGRKKVAMEGCRDAAKKKEQDIQSVQKKKKIIHWRR